MLDKQVGKICVHSSVDSTSHFLIKDIYLRKNYI
jgi:hypothetical protein